MSGGWVSLPVTPASLEIGNRDSQSNLNSNSSRVSEPCVWLRAPVSMRKAGEWSKMILTLTLDLHIQANSHTHMGSPTHVHLHTCKHAYTCIQHTHGIGKGKERNTRWIFIHIYTVNLGPGLWGRPENGFSYRRPRLWGIWRIHPLEQKSWIIWVCWALSTH